MHWTTKAALFRIFDRLPFGTELHYLAQRHVTRTWPRPEADIRALIGAAERHAEDYRRFSQIPLEESTLFEIGAGRDLIVPIALRLLGAKKVVSTDVNRLAKLDLINAAAAVIGRHYGKNVPKFLNWDELDIFGVRYVAPFDAANDPIPNIDGFFSNEVLEHIPAEVLLAIFQNVAVNLPPGGVSIHAIDYSDHYARGGGVSRYNFLQFSDDEWRPFNAGFHFVNRLRHSQYITIMQDAGLEISDTETHMGEYPDDLVVAPDFSRFEKIDLQIIRARVSAIKRLSANI